MMCRKSRSINSRSAFTLIELLIVVAIIAILAAIAVPNFLEAQTRAKISRGKADIRAMATAVETYRVDNNKYISASATTDLGNIDNFHPRANILDLLTTPIAYMSSLPPSGPFEGFKGYGTDEDGYVYVGGDYWEKNPNQRPRAIPQFLPESWRSVPYYMFAVGPSKKYSAFENEFRSAPAPWVHPYDPTNGTVSLGEILYPGGGTGGGWTSFI